MKKLIVLLVLSSIIATPSYAISFLDKIKCKEVQLGDKKVLINRFTGKAEQKLVDGKYETISSDKGFGGIPSEQDMYQARYDGWKNGQSI